MGRRRRKIKPRIRSFSFRLAIERRKTNHRLAFFHSVVFVDKGLVSPRLAHPMSHWLDRSTQGYVGGWYSVWPTSIKTSTQWTPGRTQASPASLPIKLA
jgi:hypothetical protein